MNQSFKIKFLSRTHELNEPSPLRPPPSLHICVQEAPPLIANSSLEGSSSSSFLTNVTGWVWSCHCSGDEPGACILHLASNCLPGVTAESRSKGLCTPGAQLGEGLARRHPAGGKGSRNGPWVALPTQCLKDKQHLPVRPHSTRAFMQLLEWESEHNFFINNLFLRGFSIVNLFLIREIIECVESRAWEDVTRGEG